MGHNFFFRSERSVLERGSRYFQLLAVPSRVAAAKPVTWTGRGLRFAYIGEVILAGTALWYLLSGSGRVAFVGFVAAAVFGILSIRKMWGGRREFGPDHQRRTNRAFALFWVAAALFTYALIGGLSTVPDTRQLKDLAPPIIAAGLALIAETSSAALLLWELAGSKRRRFVAGYAVLGAVLGLVILFVGLISLDKFVFQQQDRIVTREDATLRLNQYLDIFLPVVMGAFLMSRGYVMTLIRKAREEVSIAEQDALNAETAPPGATAPPA